MSPAAAVPHRPRALALAASLCAPLLLLCACALQPRPALALSAHPSTALHSSTSASSQLPPLRYTPEAEQDLVHELPGWGPIQGFNMFSGYITVDPAHGRALFYVLVESSRSPRTDPLLMWLNGGPGCSSIGGGFMSELGPFFPNADGKTLQSNPYSWNRVANLVFLEVPAFVGFSYSNTSSDAAVGDARVAEDAHSALLGLMTRFPHLQANDLFLSGESYAGHYVPMLARRIVQANARGPPHALPLKGFLVGNPSTDRVSDRLGAGDFLWAHGMISDETAEDIRLGCRRRPTQQQPGAKEEEQAVMACTAAFDRASREMGPINIYEIFADICLLPHATRSELQAWGSSLGLGHGALGQAPAAGSGQLPEVPGYDPCVDDEVETYLNLPEVQRALHANQTVLLPWRWTDCSDLVNYQQEDLWHSMVPVYEELINTSSLQLLVFSGDVDGMVPLVGTRRWISSLGLKVQHKGEWQPWLSGTQQVGGYIIKYEGLSFATIRNAGHMVPYVQPERMFHLLRTFLGERD